jgi:hypothetical protein
VTWRRLHRDAKGQRSFTHTATAAWSLFTPAVDLLCN